MSEDEDSRRVAAYRPKRSTDSRWVEIQKNTFTNWVNESLRPRGESVQELGEDLRDGTRLATLLEALSDRKIPRINRNPINNLQKMDNVSRSLDLMKKEGIKTVNIGNEDVLEGNEKLMLGLIWTLIQHYQISRGSGQRGAKYSPKKHMLLWLQTVLPECRITNLSTDWNDGIALSALVDYCRPGLFPHWRSLNRQDALQNCRNAMDIAEREFNIPQVVSPEDFSDPSLDELSGMTYLSYYVKEDGPGYDAALQALNSLVPEAKVNNFQGDLADGRVLCGMMHQLGGACPSYHSLSSQEASDNIAEALNWGKSLGVTPTFTAEEVTSGQVPSLAIMSYIAQVQAKADPEGRLIRRRSSGFHDENNLLDTEVLTQPELQSSTAVEVQQSMQAEPNAFTPSHAEEPDRGRPDFTFPPPPSSPPPIVAESTTFFVPPSPPASDNDPAETQETARYYSEIPSPVYQPPSPTTYVYAPPSPREEPTPITTHQPLPMSCHQEVAMEMVDEPLIVPEYVAPVFAPPPRSGGYGGLDLSRVSVAGNGVNQAPVGKPADIRITPTGAVGGNFVVEAESPGGRSHPVSLQKERTGYLTGHFTPEEIGQYQVSVKCDGRDVPSSPFNCNVYDPDRVRVMGMNRALLGSLAAFGVETGTAGEGDIDVTVRGPNGRKCPNKIRPEGAGNYRVTYSPNETGWHEVEIEFNGDDIPGSPFRQEVVDSWNVTAEGEGLGPKVTGSQMHEFSVLGTAGGELMVNIQSPSGRRVPETLGARYGDYLCSYVPTEAGMHTIDVAYNGMTVQGSPFHVEVTDASAVSLFPVDQGIIGRPVDFDIDASRAGNGRIDVTVMDGRTSLPVNLSPSGGNRYSASFVPQTANPHDVTVTFEGQNVPRSPFRVNIIDASRVRASGDGLDRVPIGTGTEFFVDSQGGGDADVAVKITGPTGRDVPARVSGGNGHWTVQYTPTEVCDHNIMVTFAGMQIYGSPFLSHCYDINQVQVGDIPNGKMGQPVQVEIDTSRAGHGDLAANVSVNYQNVPCDLRSRGADSYLLTFVPQTTVTHDLVFKFNGSIIPGCPYRCKIVDASQVTAHGDGLDRIPVDRPTNFYIDTSRAGDADIDVRIAGTEAKNVPVKLTGGSGKYVAEYTPTQVGEHQVTVTYAGRQIPGSPFSSYAYDVNQIRVGNIPRGRVGHPVEVFVDATKAGSGVLEATVNCPTDPVTSQMDSIGQDRFKLVFVPRCNHPHDIAFKFNGNVVPGSPYKCYISDASQAQARGDGLDRVPIKTPASFVIDTSRAGNGDVVTIITSPSGRNIPCRLSHQGTLYDAEYVPLEVGDHQIDIHFDQQPIPGSPFHCHVYDVSGVRIREIPQGRVGKTVQVEVDTSLAGRGSLQGDVSVLRNPVASNLSSMDSDRYLMTFVPQSVDPHNIVFKFNGSVVPGSPFPCYILDAGLVRVTGDGLDRVPVNSQTQVFLDATRAGDAEVDVSIKSPSGRAVPTRVSGKGNYTVDYTPTEVGPHKIDAKFGGMEVNGSPFTSYAYDVSKVRVGHVPNGVVGRPVDIDVDTSQAGPGELAAAVTQNYQPIPCTLKHKGGDVYTITFIPQNTQVHDLLFKFNGTIVPGSPFHVYIIDAGLVTVTGEGLDRVPVGRPTDFLVDTTRAGESGLDVSITGPGGRRVPCRPSGHGNYTIEYTPTEVGPHNIDVFFAGLEVPGSPFTSYAYDASQIRVGHVPDGIIGRPVSIEVDTSQAGFGDLMANVSTNYQTVPSTLEGRSSDVWVLTFVPQTVQTHDVVFKFNNDIVPGSPFPVKMIDASSVHASGDGLDRVPVNRPTHFKIDTSRAGDADIVAHITSPSGGNVPCRVSGRSGNYTAEYTPYEVGDHNIVVTFAGQQIMGSPFNCHVYDARKVRVGDIPLGKVGQPVTVLIDTTQAGVGDLQCTVSANGTVPSHLDSHGTTHNLMFAPRTAQPHELDVKFNGQTVPGSPFTCHVVDQGAITVLGDGLGRVPVDQPANFTVDATRAGDAELKVDVLGPSRRRVPCSISGRGKYDVEYVPTEVGPHTIDVTFAGDTIPGSPFGSYAYDANRVKVLDIPNGRVGEEVPFQVDCTQAGEGELAILVTSAGRAVPSTISPGYGNGIYTGSFVPRDINTHDINVKFSGHTVPGSPFHCHIMDATQVTATGDGLDRVPINQRTWVNIDTRSAGDGDVNVTAMSPSTLSVPVVVRREGQGMWRAEYTPTEVGEHTLDITFVGMPIYGSPFTAYAYDVSKVRVRPDPVGPGQIGKTENFTVDASQAGTGHIDVSVSCERRNVPISVQTKGHGIFDCSFVPRDLPDHLIVVKFNGQIIPNCPMVCEILDAGRVTGSGPGLGVIPINRLTSFSVRDAHKGDISVNIQSPSGRQVPVEVMGPDSHGHLYVTWKPTESGLHTVDVLLGEDHIQGSPFTVRVFDAQKVKVHSLEGGLVGQPHSFIVDTSEAGPGHIRVVIHAGRTEVPHQILDLGGGKYKVTYTPQENVDHMIMVEWNEVAIPAPTGVESRGDQFVVPVADVGLIQASGVGLIGSIPVNSLAQFRVLTHGQTGGDPTIIITAPSRRQVPCHVQPGRGGEYTVEYTPNETGPHRIEVMYASMPINGSPFTSQVYDSSKVRVNDIPNGYIGKPNSFSIDATQAGPGEVTVDVGNPMHVPEQLQNLGGGRYKCDFTPTNTNRHDITVKFNGELVPGNVFHCDVVDAGNVTVTGSGLDLIPVNQPAQFIVDPHGGPPAEVRVNINEPNGRPLPNRVTHQYDGTHLVEYTPKTVGAHPIDVHYAGLLVPGSPFECIAYDANKVRISDIRDGFVGQELGCKIDTSQAGPGTVTAEVQQSGRPVNHYLREDPPGSGRYSLMYTPDAARAHEIRVRFNGQAVQGSPFREEVFDPRNAAAFGEGLGTIPVKKATYFIVDPRSAGKADISANISAPSGNMVPSRVVPGRDGTHKVEYTPYEVGPHQADVFYAGYPINGSPFQPVAYDASAVRVSEIPDGRVGQKIGFNIDTSRAGKGDLDVGVNVNNRNVPFEMDSGRQRDNFEVSFLAQEAGTHRIPISFNGDPVQGSPFRSEIKAAGRASASGEGLYRGQEDRTAEFVVDTTDCDNLPLDIQVDGPNSIAKCSVEHRGDKHYVTYVPVEVGIFDITLKHGGQEIDGSPFHPTVIDPRKVRAKGGWNTFLGSNGRLTLFVNERYTLPLDAAEAGPGKMSSMVRGPTGEIPVDIEKRNDGMHFVSFTPVADGEHVVDVNWSDLPIARSPIYGDARASRDALVSHEKVVVRGRGLREAKVGEEAEFIIDGSEAGPGTPEVMMSGLKNDIDVRMVPMTDRPNSYRCYYYPKVPGAYLLNITWSQRQVNGSPFRVSIAPGIDAKKVTFSGLKEGIMGQALRADIDVREAGKGGTLTARCQGPTKRADIDLKDNMNGTFGLTIRPQEGGRHLLEIKYGGEHIQGSPFVLRIAGATDPSKVRVFGPGLKNGLLHTFKGNFICETRGAGAGQLKVRVHGPRGAFRVEMQPLSSKDRTIAVKYNPVEPGDYDIDVKWSDVHVPGSPFRVSIFETQDELDEFEGRQISRIGGSTSRHSRHSGPEYNSYQWQEEI
ncbi:filamin-A-like isoform X5 [Branchiostoma floridae x Branchiostoma japonicum]